MYTEVLFTFNEKGELITVENIDDRHILHLYDIKKDKEILSSELGVFNSSLKTSSIRAMQDGNMILLYGDAGVIIEPENYSRVGFIPNILSINPSSSQIVITSDNEIGHVPYRTLDEMIAEGKKLITY